LCKTRFDHYQSRTYYFLRPADFLFPFKYAWQDDMLSFDFTGIVFKKKAIASIEYGAVEYDFLLRRHDKAPQPYGRHVFLLERFPVDGPDALIASLMEKVAVSPPPPITEERRSPPKKDMSKANAKRRENTEARWKEQFSVGVAAAVFCLEEFRKTGKPVTQKEYKAALQERGHGAFMIEAEELFRKLMPPEALHRGD